MTILVTDPELADRLRREREESDAAQHDEVWDGVSIMSPLPNVEHQEIAAALCFIFQTIVPSGEGKTYPGVNVSDREGDWAQNFREPDVAVYLTGNPARNCGTHWCGGPDLAVEILSPNDRAREKLAFYAEVGVREFLVVDRQPWALELYRREAGALVLAGVSTVEDPAVLASQVLPLAFRLVADVERPRIEVTRPSPSTVWRV